jgi:hypothetical protein
MGWQGLNRPGNQHPFSRRDRVRYCDRAPNVLSRPAHDRDQLVKRPLFDEILASLDSECGANRRLGSINVANYRRLDLLVVPWKSHQDDVTDPEPLYGELDRHQLILECQQATSRPDVPPIKQALDEA